MYKVKYILATLLVKFNLLFTKKNSNRYYRYTFLLEDIQDEKNHETICKQMKKNWI